MKNKRILIVDDEPRIRKVIMRMLQPRDHSFEHADDGQEGLTRWTWKGPFDLVLTDLNMPSMDGHQMALRLGNKVPIIFLTSESGGLRTKIDEMATSSEGRIVVLDKPFSQEVLLESVDRQLQRKY